MATTHLEVYRPFTGELRPPRLRWWPLVVGGVRVACKRRLPLLLLYAVPTIATIIFSFFVYAKFAAEEAVLPQIMGGGVGFAELLAKRAMERLEVRRQIIEFHTQLNMFTLLVAAWYGCGLLCDDRRAGAHQLYFARPLTRRDYFLGKLLTVAFFAGLASLAPAVVIVLVASFSSPEWAFLKEEWDVLPRALAFSVIWSGFMCSLVLLASSLASRKAFALVGVFAVLFLSSALGAVLGEFIDPGFFAFSVPLNMEAIAHALFGRHEDWLDVGKGTAFAVILPSTVLMLLATARRLRKLEVVA